MIPMQGAFSCVNKAFILQTSQSVIIQLTFVVEKYSDSLRQKFFDKLKDAPQLPQSFLKDSPLYGLARPKKEGLFPAKLLNLALKAQQHNYFYFF